MMKKNFLIVILFLSFYSFSQDTTDNNSLFDNDTTKLSVSVLKFTKFNTIDTSGIDTSQKNIDVYDLYMKDITPVINLGQIATPSLPLVFAQRKNFDDFMFLNPYYRFIFKPKDFFYLKTTRPFTDLYYIDGPKLREEQKLNALHSQSFKNDSLNFGVKFNMMTAMNIATNNENSSINKLGVWAYKKFKKYNLYFLIYSNKIKRLENGGIVDTMGMEYFNPTEAYTFFLNNQAVNIIINRGVYANHSYDFKKNIKFRHILNYSIISKTFFESAPNQYLGTPMLTEGQTYDSTGVRSFDNTIDVHFYDKLGLSFTNRLQRLYYFRGFLYNLDGQLITDHFFTLSADKLNIGNFYSSFLANYHFMHRKAGDFDVISENKYFFTDSAFFSADFSFKKYTPDYFYDNYNGNYQQWNNNFLKISKLNANAKFVLEKYFFEIGADYTYFKNYVYFDSTITPTQANEPINIRTLWLKKTFNLGPLVTDINFYWQKSSNNNITNIPEFVTAGSLYFDFPIAKGALNINIGINAHYSTDFYAYAYSPSLGVFYQDNEVLTGNYPVANVFLSGNIKRAYIILRFDHANAWLLQNYYQTTNHYHLVYHYFRFGARWWFKN